MTDKVTINLKGIEENFAMIREESEKSTPWFARKLSNAEVLYFAIHQLAEGLRIAEAEAKEDEG